MRRRDKDGRLKPLTLSARLSLLRAHGVHQVDREESAAIEIIQVSDHWSGGIRSLLINDAS